MAKYGRAKKYDEKDGYWFSTENGTHIHVEEGQTPREAVDETFKRARANNAQVDKENAEREKLYASDEERWGNKEPQSYNGAKARRNPNFDEKEYGEFFDERGVLKEGKEDEYFDKVNRLDKETHDKNYNQAKEINNYEKVKNIYDRQVEDKGEDSPEARGTKRALDEFKENFDKGNNKEFKLDKKKYPDVEETRYGFIYNVDGVSITDIAAQDKKFGYKNIGSGFSVAKDGDETYFDTFEDAYNFAKRRNNEEDDDYFDIDGYHATGRKENKEKLQGYVDRAREQERRNNEEEPKVESPYVNENYKPLYADEETYTPERTEQAKAKYNHEYLENAQDVKWLRKDQKAVLDQLSKMNPIDVYNLLDLLTKNTKR